MPLMLFSRRPSLPPSLPWVQPGRHGDFPVIHGRPLPGEPVPAFRPVRFPLGNAQLKGTSYFWMCRLESSVRGAPPSDRTVDTLQRVYRCFRAGMRETGCRAQDCRGASSCGHCTQIQAELDSLHPGPSSVRIFPCRGGMPALQGRCPSLGDATHSWRGSQAAAAADHARACVLGSTIWVLGGCSEGDGSVLSIDVNSNMAVHRHQ